jgi:hypothetical protein
MVEYVPPPKDLSQLNAIQRYMQKGELEWPRDYLYLIALVAAYVICRPAIHKIMKYLISDEKIEQGEQERNAYHERRAQVGPNAIRGVKGAESTVVGSSEVNASGASTGKSGEALNRKAKGGKKVSKAEAEKLLDWDDEPAREGFEGEKTDVMAWLSKWDKEQS